MEQLLNKGAAGSDLGFLRMLQIVHIQASTLVEDLKTHELPVVVPRSPLDNTEFRRSLSSSSSSTPSQGTTAVSVMLESAMEELFVPYTEGQRYLERESKCLANLYARRLTPFARYHVCSRIISSGQAAQTHSSIGANARRREKHDVWSHDESAQFRRKRLIHGAFDNWRDCGCGPDETRRHRSCIWISATDAG